jgi:hypothetical protein
VSDKKNRRASEEILERSRKFTIESFSKHSKFPRFSRRAGLGSRSEIHRVQAVFDCPKCLKSNVADVTAASTAVACRHCGWVKPIASGDIAADSPQKCLVCGCSDLWRQKDFPQQLGVLIVILGIIGSTIAWALMRPMVAIGVLMAFALVDMVLYAVMRDALACYRCHARYRFVGSSDQHAKFNLELNERYRQEAARVQASQSKVVM